MALPKPEYDTEVITETYSNSVANQRMKDIVATPEEAQRYKYDPNCARNNRHPGIPCDD